jgi:hypothetical protein
MNTVQDKNNTKRPKKYTNGIWASGSCDTSMDRNFEVEKENIHFRC